MSTKSIEKTALPSPAPGNRRHLTVIRYGQRQKGGKAYLQAGLHAGEAPGMMAMHHLIQLLDQVDQQGGVLKEIVLVPSANPIGLAQWGFESLLGRQFLANGVNFNRDHLEFIDQIAERVKGELGDDPEANVSLIRAAMSEEMESVEEPEEGAYLKKALYSLAYDADIVLDLHCDEESLLHVYTGTPLWPDMADLSAQMGAEVTLLASDSGGRPFDEACSKPWWVLAEKFPERPIPTACQAATVELRGMADVNHEFGKQDAANLFSFLKRRGYIAGQASDLPELLAEATPLTGLEYVRTKVGGVVTYLKHPGDKVRKGDVVAHVLDPTKESEDERITEITTGIDGLFMAHRTDRHARPGSILARIAGKEPIQGKGDKLLTL